MNFDNYRQSLDIFSKIIKLFSLTKNLNREQWGIIKNELWNVITKDISLSLSKRPHVQIIENTDKQSFENPLSSTKFNLNEKEILKLNISLNELNEDEKMLLCCIVEHLKAVEEWRESLETGFEIQKRLGLLHRITVSIRASLNISEVLARTAQDLGKILGVSRCFIRRYDPNDKGRVLATEQEFVAPGFVKAADIIFDFETEWMKNFNVNQNNIDEHIDFLYIPNVKTLETNDEFTKTLAEEINLVSFLAVPLIYKDNILGSLCFHQCDQEKFFSDSEIEFIRQVADEATGAITNAEMYQQIQKQARTDSLTLLYNKSHFHEAFDQEIERTKRTGSDLSLMMIDLDFLKTVNDTYGHMVGDEMIKLLGTKLRQTLRGLDIIARFGGDEFGVILPETKFEGAKLLGARLIEQILATKHPLAGNMSASIGVAGTPYNKLEKEILIEEADKALYLAKKRGKGMACFSDDPDLNLRLNP